MRRSRGWLGALFALLLAGCAVQRHEAPLASPALAQAVLLARSPDDPQWRPWLARQGVDTARWPLPAWDGAALRALALQLHPEVRAAQADWRQAQAGMAAGLSLSRPGSLQGIDLSLERHSAEGAAASPWSLGIAFDLGLSEALLGVSRREARGAAATALADEAVAQAALVVWQVQARVRDAHRAWLLALQRAELAEALERARRDESSAWQTRLSLGAADAREAAQARQRHAEAEHESRLAAAQRLASRQALAAVVGLGSAQAERLPLAREEWLAGAAPTDPTLPATDAAAADLSTAQLQQAALLDRLDVRAGVARYAAADAALRLELARQLPELVWKPGWAWDQGDRRWSLGVGITLPPVAGNRAAIDEASARRDSQAARFEVVQLQALGELAAAQGAARAAQAELARTRALVGTATRLAERAQRRLSGGTADRLEVLEARVAVLEAQRRVLDARAADAAAQAAIEDAVQRPLDTLGRLRSDWLAGGSR